MKKNKSRELIIHAILITFVILSMLPFVFVVNNSFRTNSEIYHTFFGLPNAVRNMAGFTMYHLKGEDEKIVMKLPERDENGHEKIDGRLVETSLSYSAGMKQAWTDLTKGYKISWRYLREYMLNSIFVCVVTAVGVILIGSMSAYIFARYRFPGSKILYLVVISMMMIPAVLTLVPGFLLVKKLNLLNSYWVLILPYIAGGQVFAIFIFKSYFEGLPEDLFESARIDGAGHFRIYCNIVFPLSKSVVAVVAILNILGTWNNFLWPFITNTDPKYHVVTSGLFLMGQSPISSNFATMCASFCLSSIPLLILFIYATRPFTEGLTSGAFKA